MLDHIIVHSVISSKPVLYTINPIVKGCVDFNAQHILLLIAFVYVTKTGTQSNWTQRDSNPRPFGCEPNALPTELRALYKFYITSLYKSQIKLYKEHLTT